jgi:hypothetical protein
MLCGENWQAKTGALKRVIPNILGDIGNTFMRNSIVVIIKLRIKIASQFLAGIRGYFLIPSFSINWR